MKLVGIATVGLSILCALAVTSQAQDACVDEAVQALEDNVFRVFIKHTDGRFSEQTAFYVGDKDGDGNVRYQGLFTALHGVIDAERIEPSRGVPGDHERVDYNSLSGRDFEIKAYDFAADIAFIAPVFGMFPIAEAGEFKGSGLLTDLEREDIIEGAIARFSVLCGAGHPLATPEILTNELRVRPEQPKLVNLLGDVGDIIKFREYIKSFRSPSPDQVVYSLNDALRKGDSGSPLVNNAGEVVAIANGGVGPSLNWAIPLASSCFFATADNTCPSGQPDAAVLEQYELVLARFAEGRASLFATTELRRALEFGAIADLRKPAADLNPFNDIEARATFESCSSIRTTLTMTNRDPVFGFCAKPRLELYGEDGAEPFFRTDPDERFCLSSVLEDEAQLRLQALVSDPATAAVTDLLGMSEEDVRLLGESVAKLCETREKNGVSCEPFRSQDEGAPEPPYFNTRTEIRKIDLTSMACTPEGTSAVFEMRWVVDPARKAQGVYDTLNRLERGLAASAKEYTRCKDNFLECVMEVADRNGITEVRDVMELLTLFHDQ